jgi:1-phosphatidylinositol-4-phosphate 5-kinase
MISFNWSNGETYIGEWSDGKMTGIGQKLQIDGSMLEGAFNCGKIHGWGNKTFIEGDHFEGLFENDSRHGYGEYSWFDGSKYCGLWSRDDAHGVGVMVRGHAGVRMDNAVKKVFASHSIHTHRLTPEAK